MFLYLSWLWGNKRPTKSVYAFNAFVRMPLMIITPV